MVYPIKMKEAVIKKVQMGGKPHHEIASEAGIGRSTLTYWLKNHKKDGNKNLIEKEKRPQRLDCRAPTECFNGNRCHAGRGTCFLVP